MFYRSVSNLFGSCPKEVFLTCLGRVLRVEECGECSQAGGGLHDQEDEGG